MCRWVLSLQPWFSITPDLRLWCFMILDWPLTFRGHWEMGDRCRRNDIELDSLTSAFTFHLFIFSFLYSSPSSYYRNRGCRSFTHHVEHLIQPLFLPHRGDCRNMNTAREELTENYCNKSARWEKTQDSLLTAVLLRKNWKQTIYSSIKKALKTAAHSKCAL